MRWPRSWCFLGVRLATSWVLVIGVLVALSDYGHGQGVPPWIGRWQRYEKGGAYIGTDPSASPEGESVVYSTPVTGHGDIYRYDRNTGKNVRLTSDPEYDGEPVYATDGKRIFFVREKDNIGHLWVMDGDGRQQKQLTDGPTIDSGPVFSPNGKTGLFQRVSGGLCHLWVMDSDGGHQKPLTNGPVFDGGPIFSSDGTTIVFSRRNEIRPYFTPLPKTTIFRVPQSFL